MTETYLIEASSFRYYLDRILALDGPVPEELKCEIIALLMICDAGTDAQKLLEERDRHIQMLDIICDFAFERIATLEYPYLAEEPVHGQDDAFTRSQKGEYVNICRQRLN